MSGGDDHLTPPSHDGEFLLRLLQSHRHHHHQQPPNNNLTLDPAVAAVGPPLPHHPHPNFFQHPNHFPQTTPPPPPWPHHQQQQQQHFLSAPHQHFDRFRTPPPPDPTTKVMFGNIPFTSPTNANANVDSSVSVNVSKSNVGVDGSSKGRNFGAGFGLFKEREVGFDLDGVGKNGFDPQFGIDPRAGWVGGNSHSNNQGGSLLEKRRSGVGAGAGPPPGFSGKMPNERRAIGDFSNVGREMSGGSGSGSGSSSEFGRGIGVSNGKGYENERRFSSRDSGVGVGVGGGGGGGVGLCGQVDHPGLPAGNAMRSVRGSDVEESLKVLRGGGEEVVNGVSGVSQEEVDELSEQLVDSVIGEDVADEKNETSAKKKNHRDKDFRSDPRGKWILNQRMRNSKRMMECRRDIYHLSAPFLAIYESLIPPEEEKAKQKQLMTLLEKLVCKEWPNAKLYLYGSCANSFGVSKSDIDVCLAIDDQSISKSEILLKLADILQSDNLQNVQALTRARVPIVKLLDPVTGISCDICINNVLAVVNTKLLRDYAEIDVRLRQLAFLVKHWAKSRGVNETYQGTLSSYAYVLMCIHFLQQRNPPILPCLQEMRATYSVTVDDIECTYFDQVERLRDFGSRNKENIAHLMWGFFSYWAYCHDFTNSVISVRTGSILSKHGKDWTRRVGNDRHLICIEDPFETSHDLGRVVDKHSIRVLREEFERAAYIMQNDQNPWVALFEPYIPS